MVEISNIDNKKFKQKTEVLKRTQDSPLKQDSRLKVDLRKPFSTHWADIAAHRLLREKGDKSCYTLASGITPSGTIHIGNFRELITTEMVGRALVKLGKQVRFILSWDDYDVFRKVPKNFSRDELSAFLGCSISEIKSPLQPQKLDAGGDLPTKSFTEREKEDLTYARGNQLPLEIAATKLGVCPTYLYQNQKYKKGEYVEGIRTAMRARKKIIGILNDFREKPLAEDWTPLAVYCRNCDKQTQKITDYDEEYSVGYRCEHCQHQETIDVRQTCVVKLAWRIDWPMRWAHEQVDFEPGGKDHSSPGGSFDTGKEIATRVFSWTAPSFLHYDFVGVKGKSGKMSSSVGDVVTPAELLEIYEPEMIRYFFASVRSNVEFSIGFDAEVIASYDKYDRLQRQYYEVEPMKKGKEAVLKRVYELSQVEKPLPEKIPFQAAFRHLTSILQIHRFDVERVIHYYGEIRTHALGYENENWQQRLMVRCNLAKYWLQNYAPAEFCFSISDVRRENSDLSLTNGEAVPEPYTLARNELAHLLASRVHIGNDTILFEEIYGLIRKYSLENTEFFRLLYLATIGKPQGPRLASFLNSLTLKDVQRLL